MKGQRGGKFSLKNLFSSGSDADLSLTEDELKAAEGLSSGDMFAYGAMPSTVSDLLRAGSKDARARRLIYDKWAEMEANPFVSSALALQTTAALGGHESTGEVVFIETKSEYAQDKSMQAVVDEVATSLTAIFNRSAFPLGYIASTFGDSYCRIYAQEGIGVQDLYYEELVRPQLVQPYERGSKTLGYLMATGKDMFQRLSVGQMARVKMPRMSWVPQHGVVEKSFAEFLMNDNAAELPLLPSMAGGSFLYNAEDPYEKLNASMVGLVGQRWMDSIDEKMLSIDMENMTADQQKTYVGSIVKMLETSKKLAKEAVDENKPLLQRIVHVIPKFGGKGIESIGRADGGSSGRAGSISIEDIMLHARALAGALGTDLSMIGFADQLSGGLGDGGFFRVSAQSAERSRMMRIALSEAFNHIADVHLYYKSGGKVKFAPHERPWQITFYSTISALAKEQSDTQLTRSNSGLMVLQALQQMKDAGVTKDGMASFLKDEFLLDEDKAKVYAEMYAEAAPDKGGEEF